MSKPLNIFIIRHGQSIGNVDEKIYNTILDCDLTLTDKGVKQSDEVGKIISSIIPDSSVQFYISPYMRTQQTFLQIQKYFKSFKFYEDPRLREQEVGKTDGNNDHVMQDYEDNYHFYYKYKSGGESCANVFDRMSSFIDTMFVDFEKFNFPDNVIIVSHGMAMRLFLMRFYRCSVDEFQTWRNPWNCEYYHLKLCKYSDKYSLVTPVKSKTPKRKRFDWGEYENFGLSKVSSSLI